MNLRRFILFIMAAFVTAAIFFIKGQPTLQRIGLEQGLPNATVVDIAQDPKGFLWFATKQGLCRFDGSRFISYHTGNSKLSGNELNALLVDPQDSKLWIATERDGLNLFDPEKRSFHSFRHDPRNTYSISSDEITALAPASQGGVWIANYSTGVDLYHPQQRKFSHFNAHTIQGMPSDHIWSICEDQRGFLYIGHLKNGLTVVSIKDKTARNYRYTPNDPSSIPNDEVISLFIDPKENIWVGTRNGLALFNANTGRFRTFRHIPGDESSLLTNQIYDLSYKPENELWISCRMGGVSILDLNQDLHNPQTPVRFKHITAGKTDSQLSSIHVYPVLNDKYGNTWIGFEGDGINCLPHESSPFKIWQNTPSQDYSLRLRGYIPLSLCVQSGRDIWVGEDAAGVDFFSNGNSHPTRAETINRLLGQTIVQSLFKDSKGKIWFGTFLQGIVYYDPHDGKIERLNPDPSLPLHIRCIYEDRNGIFWIGTHHGIYLYNPNTKNFSKPESINTAIRDNILRSITGDKAGYIYVATFGKGLTQFSPTGKRTGFQDLSKGFPSNTINTVYCDLHGEIWAGTRKGLIHFNTKNGKTNLNQYTVYDERQGLSNSCIRAIEEDSHGNLWISTNNGISNFHRKEKIFYNYTWKDGLPRGEFQDDASACDESGTLYFASRKGIVYFTPSDFYQNRSYAPVYITEVILYGRQNELQEQSIPFPENGKGIKLPYDKNTLSIGFGILDRALTNRIEYAYRLEGLDKEWYNCKEPNVTFRNLPHGNYIFHLKYRFKGKEWIELPDALPIQIVPPWWLSTWAKLSYFLLSIGILSLLLQIYNRRKQLESSLLIEKENHRKDQEINSERLTFFTNIAHELRTPLTLIIGPLEDLMHDSSLSGFRKSRLSLIYRNASRLRELTNQILEFRKTETKNRKLRVQLEDCTPLAQEITLYFAESNGNPELQIHMEIQTQDTLLWYDKEILTLILNNLFSNAVKHTRKGKITLFIEKQIKDNKPYLTFTIKDTGEGIPEKELPHIFERYYQVTHENQTSGTGIGLALVKNLAELHHALITVHSQIKEGSAFCLWLEKEYTYPEAQHLSPSHQKNEPAKEHEKKKKPLTTHVELPSLLLIEDHTEIREYIEESLKKEYRIFTASNGKEGIKIAFAEIPDLIISDVLMPVMDGIELCKALKSDIRTSHIPIILLTAKDSTKDQTIGYEAGADSYLVKPFSSTLLKTRISNLLHSRFILAESWKKRPFSNPHNKRKLNKLDEDFLENFTNIIEKNIDSNDIDIAFIAEKLHLSHSTLYRKVKALTGLSINSFILKIKMFKAAEMLATGKFTVLEVMYHIGINTPAYFRKCFKECFGCLPSEYNSDFNLKDTQK